MERHARQRGRHVVVDFVQVQPGAGNRHRRLVEAEPGALVHDRHVERRAGARREAEVARYGRLHHVGRRNVPIGRQIGGEHRVAHPRAPHPDVHPIVALRIDREVDRRAHQPRPARQRQPDVDPVLRFRREAHVQPVDVTLRAVRVEQRQRLPGVRGLQHERAFAALERAFARRAHAEREQPRRVVLADRLRPGPDRAGHPRRQHLRLIPVQPQAQPVLRQRPRDVMPVAVVLHAGQRLDRPRHPVGRRPREPHRERMRRAGVPPRPVAPVQSRERRVDHQQTPAVRKTRSRAQSGADAA